MNWLRVSQNSAPLYRDSGLRPEEFDVQVQSTAGGGGHESFFNTVDNVHTTAAPRFCLPHQVRRPRITTD